ncbi:MAG: universal stress protein [Actinomycetota bacterium]|nr:universal stress protein [Actinomycetota bacterium]
MAYRNIMVPFDGSESAQNALMEAKSLTELDPSNTLHVVNVAPIPESQMFMMIEPNALEVQPAYYNLEEFKALREKALEEKCEELRETVAPLVGGLANTVEIRVVNGNSPADAIVNYAEQHGCDVIVMGCRGLGAIRGMLGSVSYGVIRTAAVPVLIVK